MSPRWSAGTLLLHYRRSALLIVLIMCDCLFMQFHVEVFSTKPYNCHCTACGHKFTQNVQKGVDNGCSAAGRSFDVFTSSLVCFCVCTGSQRNS
jgi:hypothetical protein